MAEPRVASLSEVIAQSLAVADPEVEETDYDDEYHDEYEEDERDIDVICSNCGARRPYVYVDVRSYQTANVEYSVYGSGEDMTFEEDCYDDYETQDEETESYHCGECDYEASYLDSILVTGEVEE